MNCNNGTSQRRATPASACSRHSSSTWSCIVTPNKGQPAPPCRRRLRSGRTASTRASSRSSRRLEAATSSSSSSAAWCRGLRARSRLCTGPGRPCGAWGRWSWRPVTVCCVNPWSSFVEGDEGSYLLNWLLPFIYCLYFLISDKHNSLPLGRYDPSSPLAVAIPFESITAVK